MTTLDILKRTKAAWPSICNASAEDKNRILSAMADSLQAQCDAILRCNAEDMDAAPGMSEPEETNAAGKAAGTSDTRPRSRRAAPAPYAVPPMKTAR